MTLINLAMTTVLMNRNDISSRTQLLAAVLMTIVAIKIVSVNCLPPTTYISYLDIFFIIALGTMFLIVMQSSLVFCCHSFLENNKFVWWIDYTTIGGLFVLWTCFEFFIILIMTSRAMRYYMVPICIDGIKLKM